MENRFKKVILHESEKADETWVNPDHIVAVTPDPDNRSWWSWSFSTSRGQDGVAIRVRRLDVEDVDGVAVPVEGDRVGERDNREGARR